MTQRFKCYINFLTHFLAASGRIPYGSDFLLMASQAAMSNPWKMPSNGPQPPLHMLPPGSVNGLNMNELSSLMATNIAMANLYYPRLPYMPQSGGAMPGSIGQMPPSGSNYSPSSSSSMSSQSPMNGSQLSPFIPTSTMASLPGGHNSGAHNPNSSPHAHLNFNPNVSSAPPSSMMTHPSRMMAGQMTPQMNNLYQNLKFHPYLQSRFIPPTSRPPISASHLNHPFMNNSNNQMSLPQNLAMNIQPKTEMDLNVESPGSP
jgi:hypothetical protein